MTLRRSAPKCVAAAMLSLASMSRAGVWGIEPVLGIAADHSTNPALLQADYSAETHEALLIDAPLSYVADALKFNVLPSTRVSDSSGYSSLASDYYRLSAAGEIDGERGSVSVSGGVSRDSSLYHDYIFNGSLGQRRDTATADLNWDRKLSERSEFDIDVNSQRVRYARYSGVALFTDYTYSSAAPTLSWQAGERTKLSVSGGAGLYKSSDGSTQSVNSSLQLGIVRGLSELWTLAANAGLSRETDRFRTPFGPFESAQNGTVFKASVNRQGSLVSLSAAVSRQLVPTGLAFLSRQDSYELLLNYPYSERLAFAANARRVKSQDPQLFGPNIDRSYTFASLTTTWRWTEKWTITASGSYVTTTYGPTDTSVAATGVNLELSRQFGRIALP
jgi:hypothetical protein